MYVRNPLKLHPKRFWIAMVWADAVDGDTLLLEANTGDPFPESELNTVATIADVAVGVPAGTLFIDIVSPAENETAPVYEQVVAVSTTAHVIEVSEPFFSTVKV